MKHYGAFIDGRIPALSKKEINTYMLIRLLGLIIFCVLVYLSLVTVGLSGLFKPEAEPIATWFSRSGSIVTVCAIFMEFLIINIQEFIKTAYKDEDEKKSHYFKPEHVIHLSLKVASYASLILVVIGTLVWGYGDVIYGDYIG